MAFTIATEVCFYLDNGGHRCHEKKLFKRRLCFDTRKYVFSNRVVDNWNSLSAQCVNSCTINMFKKHFQLVVARIQSSQITSVIVKKAGDIGISLCLLIPSWSSTVVV